MEENRKSLISESFSDGLEAVVIEAVINMLTCVAASLVIFFPQAAH